MASKKELRKQVEYAASPLEKVVLGAMETTGSKTFKHDKAVLGEMKKFAEFVDKTTVSVAAFDEHCKTKLSPLVESAATEMKALEETVKKLTPPLKNMSELMKESGRFGVSDTYKCLKDSVGPWHKGFKTAADRMQKAITAMGKAEKQASVMLTNGLTVTRLRHGICAHVDTLLKDLKAWEAPGKREKKAKSDAEKRLRTLKKMAK